jgi:hypothetical protein
MPSLRGTGRGMSGLRKATSLAVAGAIAGLVRGASGKTAAAVAAAG